MTGAEVQQSSQPLLDGYRAVGRWLSAVVAAAMTLLAAASAVNVLILSGSTITSMSPFTAGLSAVVAIGLWLVGSGRHHVARPIFMSVAVLSTGLWLVSAGCDVGTVDRWCPASSGWSAHLPSTQAIGVFGLLAWSSVLVDNLRTGAQIFRGIILVMAGLLAVGTTTAIALGHGEWVFLPRIRPMVGMTASVMLLLAIATMAVRPDRWPLDRLVKSDADKVVVNHMLPWILAVPFLPGVLGLAGRTAGMNPVTLSIAVTVGPAMVLLAALGVAVREQRRVSNSLTVALRQYELTVEQSPIGIALVDPDGRFIAVNSRLCNLFERDRATLLAMTVEEITHPDDRAEDLEGSAACLRGERSRYEMEKRYLLPDGRWLPALLSKALVRDDDGTAVHFVSQVIDLTERRRVEDRLRDDAGRDPLTWVANRRGLEQWYDERDVTRDLGVVFIDLDAFKPVNDSHGHPLGDLILQEVAERLRREVRADDAVARVGGDEFVVIVCDGASDGAAFDQLVARLRRAFDGDITVQTEDGSVVAVKASVGAVQVPGTLAMSDALAQADRAMYDVKRARRGELS